MTATQGVANLHPGVNLLSGANLHPGANCAHEHGFKALSLITFYFLALIRLDLCSSLFDKNSHLIQFVMGISIETTVKFAKKDLDVKTPP